MTDLQQLAFIAIQSRAQYQEALAELMQAACPLGMRHETVIKLEDAIQTIASDGETCLAQLDAVIAAAQGLQH